MAKLSTIQIAAAGRLLVRYKLLLHGIETEEVIPGTGHHLVIRSPAPLAGLTIRVQTNSEPKPAGGAGRLALAWMLDGDYAGDFVAVTDLSSSRVWVFDTAEAFARAQQHPTSGGHHLIMITQASGFRGSRHSEILDEHFRNSLLEAIPAPLPHPIARRVIAP